MRATGLVGIGLVVVLAACATSRPFPIPDLEDVTRIQVHIANAPERERAITDSLSIAAVLSAIPTRRADWKESWHTLPAGEASAVLYRDSLYLGVVRLGADYLVAGGPASPDLILSVSPDEIGPLWRALGIERR